MDILVKLFENMPHVIAGILEEENLEQYEEIFEEFQEIIQKVEKISELTVQRLLTCSKTPLVSTWKPQRQEVFITRRIRMKANLHTSGQWEC